MPVPTVISPDLTPPPEINPSIAGRPGATLAESGEGLSEIGGMVTEVAERIRKAQETLALTTAGNQITAAFDQYQQQLATHGDPDNMPDATAWTDSLRSQFAKNPKYADPRVQRAIGLNLDTVGLQAQKETFARKLTLQKQDMDAQLSVLHQNAAFKAAEAWDNPTNYQAALDSFEVPAHAAEATGFITAKEHATQSQALKSAAEDVHLVNAINKENPDAMQQVLDDANAHPERYQDLQPQRFSELKKYLRTAIDTARERTDRADIARQGDLILSKYRNDVTLHDVDTKEFQPLQAAKKVDDDPDVPTNVKKYVRSELEEEAGVQQKLENDKDAGMLNQLDPLVESGQLTFKDLTRRENLPPQSPEWIPRRVADPLLSKAAQIQRENRVEGMQERAMMRQDRMDKSADLRDELLAQPGYLSDQNELTPYRLKGLSASDANIVWKVKDLAGDPGWKQAIQIMQKSSVYDQNTDEGRAKFSKDLIQFAHTVESKKLTGSDIVTEMQKELHPQEEVQHHEIVKSLLDNIWPLFRSQVTNQPFLPNVAPPSAKAPERPKNVPPNAVWNEGARQWQLPQ